MSTFDKREEGFELRFAHEEEVRFKVRARRNKMVGLWAAEKRGLAGAAADAYAKEVVMADFEGTGDDVVSNHHSFLCECQPIRPIAAVICPFGPPRHSARRPGRRPLHRWPQSNPHSAR